MTSSAPVARRVIAAAFLASTGLLAAACGSSGGSAAGSASPAVTVTVTATPSAAATGTASPTPSSSPGGPPACTTAYLQASVGNGGAAAGSSYYPIELTNVSSSTCTMFGYPGVSFATAVNGSQIGSAATENPMRPRRLVTLPPGATASALLQVVNAENYPKARCKPVTAHWLKVYPPGEFSGLYLSFTALTCSAPTKEVQVLGVGTVQPGKTGL
jgi:uncharacterized protein DUF4232